MLEDKTISKVVAVPELVIVKRLSTVTINNRDKKLCSDICIHLDAPDGPFGHTSCKLFLKNLSLQLEKWLYSGSKKFGTSRKQTQYFGLIRCEDCVKRLGK